MTERADYRVIETPLAGLFVLERPRSADARGSFENMFADHTFEKWGITKSVAQVNLSTTHIQGAVRGLHMQTPPYSEDKIVSCLEGRIFDVAVDLRTNSPTFMRWYGQVLSPQNRLSMLIPKGLAHGFQTLAENCKTLYLHTARYVPTHEVGFDATDTRLKIDWPMAITYRSQRDADSPVFPDGFKGFAP